MALAELISENSWNLARILDIASDKETLHNFLVERKLIPQSVTCDKCGAGMIRTISNEKMWRCKSRITIRKQKRKACSFSKSIYHKTLFSCSHLSVVKILVIIYYIVHNHSINCVTREVGGISSRTAASWNSLIQQIFEDWAIKNTEKVGGPDKTVDIELSKFGKNKYHKGQRAGQWGFGGIERQSGKIFLVPVEDQSRESLIAAMKDWILPGATIISDCDNLTEKGFQHLTGNHSLSFVNEDTSTNTNAIEFTWKYAKRFLPSDTKKKNCYVGYLTHFMFLKWCKLQSVDPFDKFLAIISDREFININIEDDNDNDEVE